MQENHHIAILFDAVVEKNAVGNEIVCFLYRSVVNRLRAKCFDGHYPVPVNVTARGLPEQGRVQRIRAAQQPLSRRTALVKRAPAVMRAYGCLELTLRQADPCPL